MRRKTLFKQSDVTRAIKAAKSAGMNVVRCEIHADGKIVIAAEKVVDDAQSPGKAALERWREGQRRRGE